MDPFSLATGVVGLVGVALKLVTGALGLIDKTIAAHAEAADELKKIQGDLEDLQAQMIDIHTTLKVLASNTKDRAFKKLLQNEDSKAALNKLCIVLDDTSVLFKRLTDQTEAQESRLHSLSPPDDTKSLEFVQAVLRHNFAPSTTTNLVKSLRDMRSEIQMCLRKLETSFQHTWRLYGAMSNGLARAPTNRSTLSTSTTLTARINLVDWLKNRQGTWGISRQRKGPITRTGYDHLVDGPVPPQIPSTNNANASTNTFTLTPWEYPPVNNTSSLEESLHTADISSAPLPLPMPPRRAPLHPYSLTNPMGTNLIRLPQYIDPSDVQPTLRDKVPILSLMHSDEYGRLPAGWERRTDNLDGITTSIIIRVRRRGTSRTLTRA